MNEKYKVIIDTDPGVDDSVCLINAFFDEKADVKLITTVAGNVGIEKVTRNALHLLDLFGRDIPVAKGAARAMKRISPTAEFIHGAEGMGGYIPPLSAQKKVIGETAAEAMYRVIEENDGDVIPVLLGPQTNMGTLLLNHPDVAKKIPLIIFMGGAPYGVKGFPDHVSFNLSSDPEAFDLVLKSNIPLVMMPSNVGRRVTHLDENYVEKLKYKGDVGKFLYTMYSKYWEPDYPDKRVATNDVCTLYSLLYPEIFTFERAFITVDLGAFHGRTYARFSPDGNVSVAVNADREKFLSVLDRELEKMVDVKLNF